MHVSNRAAATLGFDTVATRIAAADSDSAHAIDGQPEEASGGTICHTTEVARNPFSTSSGYRNITKGH